MKTVAFFLSMPNVASWNGKWSGAGKLYVIVRRLKQAQLDKVLAGTPFYYRWDDGWGASVSAQVVCSAEARQLRKKSQGFCGYDWMVQSILDHGEIYADHQVPEIA